jgi:hypothetical protein
MATQIMDSGKLVPDDLVNQMVAERLAQPDTARGYILDGYPRTLAQAEWLDAFGGGCKRAPADCSKHSGKLYSIVASYHGSAQLSNLPAHLQRLPAAAEIRYGMRCGRHTVGPARG